MEESSKTKKPTQSSEKPTQFSVLRRTELITKPPKGIDTTNNRQVEGPGLSVLVLRIMEQPFYRLAEQVRNSAHRLGDSVEKIRKEAVGKIGDAARNAARWGLENVALRVETRLQEISAGILAYRAQIALERAKELDRRAMRAMETGEKEWRLGADDRIMEKEEINPLGKKNEKILRLKKIIKNTRKRKREEADNLRALAEEARARSGRLGQRAQDLRYLYDPEFGLKSPVMRAIEALKAKK